MNDWMKRTRPRGSLGFSQMGQIGYWHPSVVFGIQERNTFGGIFTEFCFVLVKFEYLLVIHLYFH